MPGHSDSCEPPSWVLLHGTPLTPAVWEPVAARLSGTVTAPRVELGEGEEVDHLADRLIAGLPTSSSEVHLVGHSFGGQVALAMALRAPHRITSLTVLCSRDTPFPGFGKVADAVRRGDVHLDGTLGRWFRPDEVSRGGAVIDYARHCLVVADRDSWARCLESIATFDRSTQTPGLTVPTRAIAAEHDTVSTVAAITELAERLPQGRLTVLRNASHMSMFLQPSELARLLTS